MGTKSYLLLTMILWGIIPILDKQGLSGEHVSPIAGMTIRVIAGVVGLIGWWLLFPSTSFTEWHGFSWQGAGLLALSGFLSMVIAQFFYYEALKEHKVSVLFPVLFAGAPVLASILGVFFLQEKMSWLAMVGCFLISVGSCLMFF
jgi:uncharacterized membrane protein